MYTALRHVDLALSEHSFGIITLDAKTHEYINPPSAYGCLCQASAACSSHQAILKERGVAVDCKSTLWTVSSPCTLCDNLLVCLCYATPCSCVFAMSQPALCPSCHQTMTESEVQQAYQRGKKHLSKTPSRSLPATATAAAPAGGSTAAASQQQPGSSQAGLTVATDDKDVAEPSKQDRAGTAGAGGEVPTRSSYNVMRFIGCAMCCSAGYALWCWELLVTCMLIIPC